MFTSVIIVDCILVHMYPTRLTQLEADAQEVWQCVQRSVILHDPNRPFVDDLSIAIGPLALGQINVAVGGICRNNGSSNNVITQQKFCVKKNDDEKSLRETKEINIYHRICPEQRHRWAQSTRVVR